MTRGTLARRTSIFCKRISLTSTGISLVLDEIVMRFSLAVNTFFLQQSAKSVNIKVHSKSDKKMRQTRLPIDWIVEAEESSSSSSDQVEEVKRGRPPHPLQWTRVKSLTLIKEQRLMVYESSKDLIYDKSLKTIRKESSQRGGEFVFDPDSLREEAKGFRVETSRLS